MKNALDRFLVDVGPAFVPHFSFRRLLCQLAMAAFLAAVAPVPAWCQLAVPEFFGFYASEGNQTVSLYEGKESGGTKTTQELYSVPRNGTQAYTVPVVSPSVRFLLFYTNAGEMIKSMTFHRLPLLRNVIEMPDNNQVSMGILSGKPVNPRVIGTPNKSLLARIPALEVRILTKPVPNQLQMVELVPNTTLGPGLYVFDYSPAPNQGWHAVVSIRSTSEQEKAYCVDLKVTGGLGAQFFRANSNLNHTVPALQPYDFKACDSSATSNTPAPSATINPGGSTGGGSVAAAACNDYNPCLQAAMAAYKAEDWLGATTAFQAAAAKNPTSGEPWIWLGRILFMDNQPHQQSDLSNVWDKALALGAELMIGACHELTLRPCERGDLALSTKSVSFLANGSQAVFSAAPADITPGRILNNSAAMHISYSMKVANKNYAIDFIPLGTQGCQFNLMVQCPQEGITKQVVMARYVAQVLPKLAGGTLTAKIAPVASPITRATPPPITSPAKSVCDQASDAGYAILLQGHLYKVRLASPAGPDQKLYFFDEKGTQVTDMLLLTQLAAAVWTHDNVIASLDARNGSRRVSGILGTSKALQTYTTVQDVVSRAMVEAVQAGLTGGASLAKAVPNVTLSALKAQLTSAPKTLLTLVAQHGLEASLAAYKQMEAVPLPPQDATALNATDLARIRGLYIQARSVELPYEALAAKLMPKSGSDLTEQALKSALGEVTGGPVFSGSPTAAVTLQNLLALQKGIANLAKSLPALQAYSEDLNLATNMTTANSETISKWASAAGQKCN